jgi:hypothetical protein
MNASAPPISHPLGCRAAESDEVTVLTVLKKKGRATKQHTWETGKWYTDDYDAGKYFRAKSVSVSGIRDIAALIERIRPKPHRSGRTADRKRVVGVRHHVPRCATGILRMNAILPLHDRLRLAKCLALLSSDRDGEVLAAPKAADRLVRNAGMQWDQILSQQVPPTARHSDDGDHPIQWRSTVQACLRHPAALTQWEIDFLRSLLRFDEPSVKQAAVLAKIADRLGVAQ